MPVQSLEIRFEKSFIYSSHVVNWRFGFEIETIILYFEANYLSWYIDSIAYEILVLICQPSFLVLREHKSFFVLRWNIAMQ